MPRLHLFVEGSTEQVFASTLLGPHLANFDVWLDKPVLVAHAHKRGITHRGGGRHFAPMQNDIVRRLKEDARADVYFTTMIDLYALHNDFPGRSEAEKLRFDPYKRVESLEVAWQKETADSRFIPFIQLHEFEAYLFADVSKFVEFFDNTSSGIAELQRAAKSVDSPELIDDGQHTAPSKRIIDQFPAYESKKTTVGPQMAELIGLPSIREKCPHFDSWINRLERLGGGAGGVLLDQARYHLADGCGRRGSGCWR